MARRAAQGKANHRNVVDFSFQSAIHAVIQTISEPPKLMPYTMSILVNAISPIIHGLGGGTIAKAAQAKTLNAKKNAARITLQAAIVRTGAGVG